MSVFQPETALERAVHGGDLSATVALIAAMAEDARPSHRTSLMQMQTLINDARWSTGARQLAWGSDPSSEQMQACAAAIFLCGTAQDVAPLWIDADDLVTLGQQFRPRALDGLAQALLARSPQRILIVQRLIAAGLAKRPDSPEYTLGLIALPHVVRDPAQLSALFARDPGLRPALLRVLEIEGTPETSLASSDKYNHKEETRWGHLLRSLVQDGITSQAHLLDKTLSALENDWPQYRSGWFSRFHSELAPSAALMREHLSRYLALCASRIAPTVTLALEVLSELDRTQAVDATLLVQALTPVCASAVKSQVEAALKLLGRAVKREPDITSSAADAVSVALVHESAVLQKSVLNLLGTWGVSEQLGARLQEMVPCVAATNRPALVALIGAQPVPPAAELTAHSLGQDRPTRLDVLDGSRQLRPIADLEELAMTVAAVFEHPTNVDDFERCIGALVQACPLSAQDKMHFSPVLKRVGKVRHALARELGRLLVFVVNGVRITTSPTVDQSGNPSPVEGLLISRIDDAIAQAASGHGLPPLSTPTHAQGFIAPDTFIDRVAAHQASSLTSTQSEQVRALLRLAPCSTADLQSRARLLGDTPFVRALRYALGDTLAVGPERALFVAASRIRHPGRDDESLARTYGDVGPDGTLASRFILNVTSRTSTHAGVEYHHHDLLIGVGKSVPPPDAAEFIAVQRHPPMGLEKLNFRWWSFGGTDPGAIAYSATVLPSSTEAFFAEGARAVGNNLDWSEAQWQNSSYLRMLLDPCIEIGPMATLLLALGLLGKEAGQQAIAVDALVSAYGRQMLDVPLLGQTLASLMTTPLVKASRLHKSLLSALRSEGSMRGCVFELLCTVLVKSPQDPPKDVALLLELLVELQLTLKLPLPAATCEALAQLKVGARGKALQRTLLASGCR